MLMTSYIRDIDEIMQSQKWIKNDIGMGRIICTKPIFTNEELMLFITANYLDAPLYGRVEKIIVINGQIIIFYDGEYSEILDKNDYDSFKELISEKEWNLMFHKDCCTKFQNDNMILNNLGYYVEAHESMYNYNEEDIDKKSSEEICKYYNVI